MVTFDGPPISFFDVGIAVYRTLEVAHQSYTSNPPAELSDTIVD